MINDSQNQTNNSNPYLGQFKLPKGNDLRFIPYQGPKLEKKGSEKSFQENINSIQEISSHHFQNQIVERHDTQWQINKAVHIKLQYSNGDIYEGEALNYCAHGFGKVRYMNGITYEGTWWNGLPEGMGTFIYQNGTLMNVKHVQGLVHGVAIVTYPNHEVEYVNFNYGFLDGSRRIFLKTGTVYEEIWEKGIRKSNVEIFYKGSNELFYWGESQNQVPHGFGKMFYNNGMIVVGQWDNGALIELANTCTSTTYQAPLYHLQVKVVNTFEETLKNSFDSEKEYNEFYSSLESK